MKTLTLFFLALALSATAQTIRIADNNANAPTGKNIYTGTNALQNALNAAVEGDIRLKRKLAHRLRRGRRCAEGR